MTVVAIVATAQNGTSHVLAERKHARRLAGLATPRTGVLGQGSSLAESAAWTGSYGGTDVANGDPPRHRAILRIHDPWSLICSLGQAPTSPRRRANWR
jgi:hypothetical protein